MQLGRIIIYLKMARNQLLSPTTKLSKISKESKSISNSEKFEDQIWLNFSQMTKASQKNEILEAFQI